MPIRGTQVTLFCVWAISASLLSAQSTAVIQPQDKQELARLNQTSIALANALRTTATSQALLSTALIEKMTTDASSETQYTSWHQAALAVTALDHSPTAALSPASFHEQYGPTHTSRALAIVHLAMFEAANAYSRDGKPQFDSYYTDLVAPSYDVKFFDLYKAAAIIESAYGVLRWLYPGLTSVTIPIENPGAVSCPSASGVEFSLQTLHTCSLEALGRASGAGSNRQKYVDEGLKFGRSVVERVIRDRGDDGSSEPDPSWATDFVPVNPSVNGKFAPSQWQQDPVSQLGIALGGRWRDVKPFALSSASQFRLPDHQSAPGRFGISAGAPPEKWPSFAALVKYGGDVRLNTPGVSLNPSNYPDLYFIAKFWSYDATAGLCAPVRLYNQIADEALAFTGLQGDTTGIARYYALVNLAMADAGIAAWESKYYFQLARPVTAIRTQIAMDGSSKSTNGELWFPLGAQNTNSDRTYNITPPFPAYPSGHAVFGGALFGVLRQYIKKNTVFPFQSDEFNGKNKDVYNFIRCKDGDTGDGRFCGPNGTPAFRQFTLDCAERENADSRIWMGVHWIFDADDGILLGNQVARAVYNGKLAPRAGAQKKELDDFVESTSGRKAKDDEALKPFTLVERVRLTCPDVKPHEKVLGLLSAPGAAKP